MSYYDKLGMFIAMILRHKPETIDIQLDEHGWANVDDLIEGIKNTEFHCFDRRQLDHVVMTDNKQRYSYNEDHTLIRANQGHSIPVDVELHKLTKDEIDEVPVLYHGTSSRFANSIDKKGLLKMGRNYVQMSTDVDTATDVGNRHNRKIPGKLVIYVINLQKMFEDGYDIFRSVNGVYLTDHVPVDYFIRKIEQQ